jgi:hypothetical protein
MEIGFFNYSIGASFVDDHENVTHFTIDKHYTANLETLSEEYFKLYLSGLIVKLRSEMQFVKNRIEDYNNMKKIGLNTINLEQFAIDPLEDMLKLHIGNLALLNVYAKEFLKEVLVYTKRLEYPWTPIDKKQVHEESENIDISHIFSTKIEAEFGLSDFIIYTELVNTELLPRFPLDQYSYNERGSE